MKTRIFIETYGCSANRSESEMMAGILEKEGMELVDSAESADVIVLNTCIVKIPTETKILQRIRKLSDAGKKVVVAGCMPEVRQREIMRIAPGACMISTHQVRRIKEAVESLVLGKCRYFVGKSDEENIGLPRKRFNHLTAMIEISKGCMGECSYCSVKGVKGKLKSYSLRKVLDEIKGAVEHGCKEIWITSQDCGCYGKESGTDLPSLLKKAEDIRGDFRVRIGMMNPEHVLPMIDELISQYKDGRIYKFLHLPVQSGSDTVLGRMRRRYNSDDFRRIISKFREEVPDISIWTDVIVGFPGESEKEFSETLRLMEETKPDFVNISKFGAMKGTPAASMRQVDRGLINIRARKLTELCISVALENNKARIGRVEKVLIIEKGRKGTLKGRDESFRQVVLAGRGLTIGETIDAEITGASPAGLFTNHSPHD